jgi:hypothetical protein
MFVWKGVNGEFTANALLCGLSGTEIVFKGDEKV